MFYRVLVAPRRHDSGSAMLMHPWETCQSPRRDVSHTSHILILAIRKYGSCSRHAYCRVACSLLIQSRKQLTSRARDPLGVRANGFRSPRGSRGRVVASVDRCVQPISDNSDGWASVRDPHRIYRGLPTEVASSVGQMAAINVFDLPVGSVTPGRQQERPASRFSCFDCARFLRHQSLVRLC